MGGDRGSGFERQADATGREQVPAFIAAQQVMRGILEILPEEEQDNPPLAVQAQLEANAKKQGFKNFQEYDDVAVNIFLIWSAIDPETKTFTEPAVAIRNEIAEVSATRRFPPMKRRKC